jgi:hypothetical protein
VLHVGVYLGKTGYQFIVEAPDVDAVEAFAAAFGFLARQESVGYHKVEPLAVGKQGCYRWFEGFVDAARRGEWETA